MDAVEDADEAELGSGAGLESERRQTPAAMATPPTSDGAMTPFPLISTTSLVPAVCRTDVLKTHRTGQEYDEHGGSEQTAKTEEINGRGL